MKYTLSFIIIILLHSNMKIDAQNCIKEDTYIPAKGTAERQDILDALRAEVNKMINMEVVFVVVYLQVYDGWAWIDALPQSIDGTIRLEDVLALVHNTNGNWEVVEIPCVEEENDDCITSESYYDRLIERFPDLPECILPSL